MNQDLVRSARSSGVGNEGTTALPPSRPVNRSASPATASAISAPWSPSSRVETCRRAAPPSRPRPADPPDGRSDVAGAVVQPVAIWARKAAGRNQSRCFQPIGVGSRAGSRVTVAGSGLDSGSGTSVSRPGAPDPPRRPAGPRWRRQPPMAVRRLTERPACPPGHVGLGGGSEPSQIVADQADPGLRRRQRLDPVGPPPLGRLPGVVARRPGAAGLTPDHPALGAQGGQHLGGDVAA